MPTLTNPKLIAEREERLRQQKIRAGEIEEILRRYKEDDVFSRDYWRRIWGFWRPILITKPRPVRSVYPDSNILVQILVWCGVLWVLAQIL